MLMLRILPHTVLYFHNCWKGNEIGLAHRYKAKSIDESVMSYISSQRVLREGVDVGLDEIRMLRLIKDSPFLAKVEEIKKIQLSFFDEIKKLEND